MELKKHAFGLIAAAVLTVPLALPVTSSAVAADLEVTRKAASDRIIRHRRIVRVVRDYDGTPVVVRRGPAVTHDDPHSGARIVVTTLEHVPAMRATPSRYLNGQPVWPSVDVRRQVGYGSWRALP